MTIYLDLSTFISSRSSIKANTEDSPFTLRHVHFIPIYQYHHDEPEPDVNQLISIHT